MFIKLWMHQDVTTIDTETPIGQAMEIIQQSNFRHLPVMKEGKLVGIITQTDIMKALPSAVDSSLTPENRIIADQAKVSSFMASNPVTAHPMDPLEDVALLMRKFKIGAVPVVEDEELVGIITETDIFQAFIEILGAGETGARIELQIKKNGTAIHTITDICKRFDMNLSAISVYKNFSQDHQLLTIRVHGNEMDKMVDALWDSGAKVNRVLTDTGED
jgi:acetoin utilization protein AcuB